MTDEEYQRTVKEIDRDVAGALLALAKSIVSAPDRPQEEIVRPAEDVAAHRLIVRNVPGGDEQ